MKPVYRFDLGFDGGVDGGFDAALRWVKYVEGHS
jgi:hypothetical protein